MKKPRRRALALTALLATAFGAAGCSKGNILLMQAPFERPRVATSDARALIRGVPKARSNKYQAMLEDQIARAIEESGLFASVARDAQDPGAIDLSLQIEPAIVAFDRRVNMAYFPLALATLTFYIWFGGPIGTDTEFYDVALRVDDASGRHLFDVSSRREYTHWVNLYSDEYRTPRCFGPHAGEMIASLVNELGTRLASSPWAAKQRAAADSR